MQKQEQTGRSVSTRNYDVEATNSYDDMVNIIQDNANVTRNFGRPTTYHSTPHSAVCRKTSVGKAIVIVVGVLLLIGVLAFLLF